MGAPLVSICLPNLNTRPFLEERLKTILGQTLTDWELIVSDNSSDDGSWEFFQAFKGDPRIRLFQAPRQGMYANWNACIQQAKGQYCYFATSDDTMSPDCLERLVTPLERMPHLSLAVCDFDEIGRAASSPAPVRRQQSFLGQWASVPSIRNGRTEFLLHAGFGATAWVTMTSVLFRRALLANTGYFRTDLGSRADEEWTLRASLASDIAYVPGKLATWRRHPAQQTGRWIDRRQAAWWKLEAIRSVLRDSRSGIPDEWKEVAGWKSAIAASHQRTYDLTFGLCRWKAKHAPLEFLRDLASAWRHTPAWALRQTLNGFDADAAQKIDGTAHVRRLIEMFHAEWPPHRLDLP